MCLAIPGKILKINGTKAVVDFDGVNKQASLDLLKDVSVGDYVLIHAGFAIEKIDISEAENTLKLLSELQNA